MNKTKTDWRIVVVGLICVTILEIVALLQGLNGMMYSTVLALIAIAIGVTIENPFKTK